MKAPLLRKVYYIYDGTDAGALDVPVLVPKKAIDVSH